MKIRHRVRSRVDQHVLQPNRDPNMLLVYHFHRVVQQEWQLWHEGLTRISE